MRFLIISSERVMNRVLPSSLRGFNYLSYRPQSDFHPPVRRHHRLMSSVPSKYQPHQQSSQG